MWSTKYLEGYEYERYKICINVEVNEGICIYQLHESREPYLDKSTRSLTSDLPRRWNSYKHYDTSYYRIKNVEIFQSYSGEHIIKCFLTEGHKHFEYIQRISKSSVKLIRKLQAKQETQTLIYGPSEYF